MKIKYFVLFFVALGLTGCGMTPPTLQATLQATVAPEPTLTPSIEMSPTATDEVLSIPTQPSKTPDLTEIAFVNSIDGTETASAPLTQTVQATWNATFPETCWSNFSQISPDGKWLADDCNEFIVVSLDRQKKLIIQYSELAAPDTEVSNIHPLYWSKDSQYLYFSPVCCNYTNPYRLAGPLYRLDVQSLTWIKMIDSGAFNLYAFSPTGRRLLHIPNAEGGIRPAKFHILDLKSGAEQWLSLDGFEKISDVLWSPDGRRFIISGQNGETFIDDVEISLFLVSLDDLSITKLIQAEASQHGRELLWLLDWSANDVIAARDCYFYQDREATCSLVMYDLKAPRVISATATP